MEAIFSGKLEKVYADLARHYEHGGNFERAIDYYVRAGDADRDVLAYREMISHWSHALELAEANHFEEPRLADIVIRLGEAMAPGPDASKYLDRALGIYERVGDEQSQARAHAALAGKFGSTSFDVMDLPRALHHCKRAEDLLRGKPTVELGYAYVAAGWSHGWMADVPKWTDAGYRALEVADALNDNSLRAAALGVVGGSLWARGKIRAAFETLDRGAALARQLQILTTLPITVNAAFNSFHLGDPRGARDWARRATEEPRFRDHPALVTFEINLLLADYLSGNLLEARQLASRYEAIIAAPTLDFVKVFIAYADSDLAEAECAQKRSVEFAAKQGRRENICNEGYGLADYQRHLRMFDESEKTLELVKSVSIEGGYVPFQVRAWEGLAATYARCNRVEKASEALARCREIVSNGEDWRDIFGRIAWTEALLASIEDNAQAATQNFDVAVASAARYENFWDRIWRLMDWADALAKFGQRELATSKFDEATALCRNADAHQPWIDRIASRRVSALGLSLPKTPKG